MFLPISASPWTLVLTSDLPGDIRATLGSWGIELLGPNVWFVCDEVNGYRVRLLLLWLCEVSVFVRPIEEMAVVDVFIPKEGSLKVSTRFQLFVI